MRRPRLGNAGTPVLRARRALRWAPLCPERRLASLESHCRADSLAVVAKRHLCPSQAIAEKLRLKAGLSKDPTGEVANGNGAARKRRAAPKKTAAKK